MNYNAPVLLEILAAAGVASCDIVHVSKLAGDEPFVAGRPCLGDNPEPLVDMTPERYLALMAELRRHLVVEQSRTIDCQIRTAGGSNTAVAGERTQLKPTLILGHLEIERAAVCYMMDSAGQETTVIYRGLGSAIEVQSYWADRGAIVCEFSRRYSATEEDLHALCRRLDRTTDLSTVDMRIVARERGLIPSAATHASLCY